jgi:hypothetical protein
MATVVGGSVILALLKVRNRFFLFSPFFFRCFGFLSSTIFAYTRSFGALGSANSSFFQLELSGWKNSIQKRKADHKKRLMVKLNHLHLHLQLGDINSHLLQTILLPQPMVCLLHLLHLVTHLHLQSLMVLLHQLLVLLHHLPLGMVLHHLHHFQDTLLLPQTLLPVLAQHHHASIRQDQTHDHQASIHKHQPHLPQHILASYRILGSRRQKKKKKKNHVGRNGLLTLKQLRTRRPKSNNLLRTTTALDTVHDTVLDSDMDTELQFMSHIQFLSLSQLLTTRLLTTTRRMSRTLRRLRSVTFRSSKPSRLRTRRPLHLHLADLHSEDPSVVVLRSAAHHLPLVLMPFQLLQVSPSPIQLLPALLLSQFLLLALPSRLLGLTVPVHHPGPTALVHHPGLTALVHHLGLTDRKSFA